MNSRRSMGFPHAEDHAGAMKVYHIWIENCAVDDAAFGNIVRRHLDDDGTFIDCISGISGCRYPI